MKRAKMPSAAYICNTRPGAAFHFGEDKYRAIIEHLSHAFLLLHHNGSIQEANPAASSIFGYSTEELLKMKFHTLVENSKLILLPTIEMLKGKKSITETTGISREGKHFPIEISAGCFIDEDGLAKYSVMISDITIRKKIKADLHLSNERYNLVVKATKDLVWDWDLLTGEIYRSGHNLPDVYGHSSNELIKTINNWAGYIHPEDKERIKTQLEYYIHTPGESDFSLEYRFRREDGSYVYISDKGYIIRNAEGIAIRMIGAAEDITERKKALLALEESEMRYKMFVKQSTEGIWRIELTQPMHINMPIEQMLRHCTRYGYIAECNDVFARTSGFETAEQVIGSPLSRILPESNPHNAAYFISFFNNGFRVQEELSYETDNEGNLLTFVNNMIGVVEGDYLCRAWGTQRNITSQKNAQAQLAASEEKYRYLFNNNPAAIIIWDINTKKILEVNASAIDLYQYPRNEFLKLSMLDLSNDTEDAFCREYITHISRYKKQKTNFDCRHHTSTGAVIMIETRSHEIVYKKKGAILTIVNNITEKVQLENSLNEERLIRQQQITEAVISGQEKERTELGQELHDNINQILASTKLYIECAMRDEKQRIGLMAESKSLIEKAMDELRVLSKSLLPPSLGDAGLQQALVELTANFKKQNELTVTLHYHLADENELSKKLKLTIFRIVQEQLNNVLKHAHAKNVFIRVTETGEGIELSVTDDGLGFNPALKRNGVGLRNISSRAEVNYGKVTLVSKPGEGCSLTVKFPPHALGKKKVIDI